MSLKTNKSYTKRLKITKSGVLKGRKPGQNHFNAKESRNAQLNKKRLSTVVLTNKARSRFLPGK